MARGTFHGLLEGMRVTWLHYPNPLLDPLIAPEEEPLLASASLKDIGLMKWVAASQCRARKDFIDLYMIAAHAHGLESLLDALPRKFPGKAVNYYHLVKSLSYFDDAEREPPPRMLIHLQWEEIKAYFKAEQRLLLNKLGEGRTRT